MPSLWILWTATEEEDVGQEIAVEIAVETDTAFGVSGQKEVPLELATEEDTALEATAARAILVELATELDTAFGAEVLRSAALDIAIEVDVALPVGGGIILAAGALGATTRPYLTSPGQRRARLTPAGRVATLTASPRRSRLTPD